MNLAEMRTLLRDEVIQRGEEGCPVQAFCSLDWDAMPEEQLRAAYRQLQALQPEPATPWHEPSALEDIRAGLPPAALAVGSPLAATALHDRVQGAWLGRAAGCLLGKPVEGWPRQHIEALLRRAGKTTLTDYFPEVDYEHGPFAYLPIVRPWLSGNIECMPIDDDMNYCVIALLTLERHGGDFTTEHIAAHWLNLLPFSKVFTAELVAYRNCVNGLAPPATATHWNPYREWIGAQIRADVWGYVNADNPARAAEFAWRDARLSHTKNGIYGEMLFAATIAAAFTAPNARAALEAGLQQIPERSRLHAAVRDVIGWCDREGDWQTVWQLIQQKYGALNRVHTINNAAYIVAGLLLSDGDFERAITTTVLCGLDTDCTGATVGSIMGALLGARALPAKWIDPLHGTLLTDLAGHARLQFTELADRTCAIARQLAAATQAL